MAGDSNGKGANHRRRRRIALLWLGPAAAALFLLPTCGDTNESDTSESGTGDQADREEINRRWEVWAQAEEQWRTMESVEDLIIALTPGVESLADSVLNLELPDLPERRLFASQVAYRDLSGAASQTSHRDLAALGVQRRSWPTADVDASAGLGELALWRPFLDGLLYFDDAAFSIADGEFLDVGGREFETRVRFSGKAHARSGHLVSVRAIAQLLWRDQARHHAGEEPDWRIAEWRTEQFDVLESASPLFEEVLAHALVDRSKLARARDSIHERHVVDFILRREGWAPPHRYFTVLAEDFHPGVSVVDLDRDGFDDFYVMARWGPNMFFRNRGDGSFEEIAAELGLDIEGHSSSAIFADFDNDGDADLALGRTLERSLILFNENGRFFDPGRQVANEPLPYLTSSVSAADYDGDGLLDLYLSTYSKVLMAREFRERGGKVSDGMLKEFLPLPDARRLATLRLAPEFQEFLNHPGPPNMLLRNLGGGRFKVVQDVNALRIFRSTFQSTWGDYDRDGDPDIYLANDFGPNNLVRNDGGGHFTDVTEETGVADIGFGMGASWGDYNDDGHPDLYVSNMYSTAGNRILKRLDHIDGTFLGAARGNTLFRNSESSFAKVSGTEEPSLMVENAGWSWAGQLTDLDNDGYEDIYALSGFYTAPKEVAIARDI